MNDKKKHVVNTFGYSSLDEFLKDIERANTDVENYKGRLLAIVERYGYCDLQEFLTDWAKLSTPDCCDTGLNGLCRKFGYENGLGINQDWLNGQIIVPVPPAPPPPPDFEQLTADHFVSLSGHATFSDGANGAIVSNTNFKQWTMGSTGLGPTQLSNACILKDNITTYAGIVCEVTDEYTCAVGNKHTGDANRMYLYGAYGMNLAIVKSDINNNTFMLQPTPRNTFKPASGDLLYIRYTPVGDRWRLNISALRQNYTLAAGNLTYTFQVAQEPLLGVSAGWQGGGGTNLVARKVMGIRHGVSLIKEALNNDDVNAIKAEYAKIFD